MKIIPISFLYSFFSHSMIWEIRSAILLHTILNFKLQFVSWLCRQAIYIRSDAEEDIAILQCLQGMTILGPKPSCIHYKYE